MKYHKITQLVILFLAISISCSPLEDIADKVLINSSSEEITIQVFPNNLIEPLDPFVIPSGTQLPIHNLFLSPNTLNSNTSCLAGIDSVQISITNDKQLKIDFFDEGNWVSDFTDNRNSNTLRCSIEIDDEDLE